MNVSPSKENILKRIRKALSHPTPLPFPQSEGNYPVMQTQSDDLAVEFAQRFSALQGKFVFCSDAVDCATQLKGLFESRGWDKIVCRDNALQEVIGLALPSFTFHDDLSSSDSAVTGCEFLVSRTGTIVLSSSDAGGRTTSVYSPVHICIAFSDQLVYDIKDALSNMKERCGNRLPSMISFATGPRRTADIEKTLVVGVHGPGEVFVFLVDAPKVKD
jgi:L-lactate dehydrogenase complex protein LldG